MQTEVWIAMGFALFFLLMAIGINAYFMWSTRQWFMLTQSILKEWDESDKHWQELYAGLLEEETDET